MPAMSVPDSDGAMSANPPQPSFRPDNGPLRLEMDDPDENYVRPIRTQYPPQRQNIGNVANYGPTGGHAPVHSKAIQPGPRLAKFVETLRVFDQQTDVGPLIRGVTAYRPVIDIGISWYYQMRPELISHFTYFGPVQGYFVLGFIAWEFACATKNPVYKLAIPILVLASICLVGLALAGLWAVFGLLLWNVFSGLMGFNLNINVLYGLWNSVA